MAKPKKSKVWGVKVGTQFYPDPGKNQQWLQVVALKSANQELIWNRSYACPQATANPHASQAALSAVKKCTEQVREDVDSLSGENALVIAVSQRVSGQMARTKPWQTQPPVGFWTAILGVGGQILDKDYAHPGTPLLRGRVSAVWRVRAGVKSIPSGTPVVEHNPDDLDRLEIGEAAGFLVRDSAGMYSAFKGSQQVPYATQAPGSEPLANVMRVGSIHYPSTSNRGHFTFESGEGGFQVLMLDPNSLQGVSETFRTRFNQKHCSGSSCPVELSRMTEWIRSNAGRYTLLLLASIGDPRVDPGNVENKVDVNKAAAALASLLTGQFGATTNRVDRALHDTGSTPAGPRSYSLVAAQGAKAGRGLEMEGPAGKADANSVPQSGDLNQDDAYEFVPQADLVSGTENNAGAKLREVALSQPGSWPEHGDPGRTAAIVWVGGQVGIDSNRSLYWSQPYKSEFWTFKATEIAKLARPKRHSFSRADFAWAKAELRREILWLGAAHAFASTLAQPFQKGQISAWKNVEGIANKIQTDIVPPSEITTREEVEAQAVFDYAREIAGAIPGVSNGIRAIEATYNVVSGLIEAGDGRDASAPFSVKAGELGKALAERLELTQEAIEDELLDIVVADYRKLRTVALCGGLSKECPDKPLEQWQFTKVEQHNAAKPVKRGVETLVYSALLPIKYDAWLLPESSNKATSHDQGHQVAGPTTTGNWCPFYQLPLSAQLALPVEPNVAGDPHAPETWQVVAYGRRYTIKGGAWRMERPGSKATDNIFQPVSEGGLGANPEVFLRRSWTGGAKPKALTEYPEVGARVHWITADTPGIHPECGWPFHI